MKRSVLTTSAALLLLILSIFAIQPGNTGFEPGHRGWVSVGGLAIAAHSRMDDGFVGYMLEFENPDGGRSYEYFTRFPIFFTAALKVVISIGDPSLSEQVYRARLVMSFIFCSTLICIFYLLRILDHSVWTSLASTAFVGSGYYLVLYQDLIFYDPPALLGIVVFWLGLALYRKHNARYYLWAGAVFAICLSQSGAIFGNFLVWALWEAYCAIRQGEKLRSIANLDSVKVSVVCLILFTGFTFYNVMWDAAIQQVSISETSVVKSFFKRTHDHFEKFEYRLSLPYFARHQLLRFGRGLTPYVLNLKRDFALVATYGLFAVVTTIALLLLKFKNLNKIQKELVVVMACSGPIWIFLLRGLTAFHDYTTIYYLGFYLVFFSFLCTYLSEFEKLVCSLAIFCFVLSQLSWARHISATTKDHNAETLDMEVISSLLPKGEPYSVEGGARKLIGGNRFAMGFYLPSNPILEEGRAKYHLSEIPIAGCLTSTPKNRFIHLYQDCPARYQAD